MKSIWTHKGYSVVEVLVSIFIVSMVAMVAIPFFSGLRTQQVSYSTNDMCLNQVRKSFMRLESGGQYALEKPNFQTVSGFNTPTASSFSPNPTMYSSLLNIYSLPRDASGNPKRASFNTNKTYTFDNRFNDLTGDVKIYKVIGNSEANEYFRSFVPPNATDPTNMSFTTDNNGIYNFVPLLAKGTVSDIADIFNKNIAIFSAGGVVSASAVSSGGMPAYLNPEDKAEYDMTMKIDRINIVDRKVLTTDSSKKYWPVPRPAQFVVLDTSYTYQSDIYSVREPDDILYRYKSSISPDDVGKGFQIMKFPQGETDVNNLIMTWDFGFRVKITNQVFNPVTQEYLDCSFTKDYFLPTDFQNVQTFDLDFTASNKNIPGYNPSTDPVYATQAMSNKFFDIGSATTAQNFSSASRNYRSGKNCGPSSNKSCIKEDFITYMNIFSGTNFGYFQGGSLGQFGFSRPECSQETTSGKYTIETSTGAKHTVSSVSDKDFFISLRIKNLDKEPGVIPMCLDMSLKTDMLKTDMLEVNDPDQASRPWGIDAGTVAATGLASGQGKVWCDSSGDNPTKQGASKGAQLLIMNDYLFQQGGFVPCESLRFCGQTPTSVNVQANNGTIEYKYSYRLNATNNFAEKNRLWGCDLAFKVALLDSNGQLSYLEAGKLNTDLNSGSLGVAELDGYKNYINNLYSGTKTLSDFEMQKQAHDFKSVMPIHLGIYAKPPPCYDCKCKSCKSKKSLLGLIVGIFLIVVTGGAAINLLGPVLAGMPVTLTNMAAIFQAMGGVLFLGAVACGFQLTGVTSGGYCSPWEYTKTNDLKEFRSCNGEPQGACDCGHDCQLMNMPEAKYSMGKDLPPGEIDESSYGYCPYSLAQNESFDVPGVGNISLNVPRGKRKPDHSFDTTAIFTQTPREEIPSGKFYAKIGEVSDFTYINYEVGYACYYQAKCVYKSGGADWEINMSNIDGQGNAQLKGCVSVKPLYPMNVASGDVGVQFAGKNSAGSLVASDAICLMPVEDSESNELWDCSQFSHACYGYNNPSYNKDDIILGPVQGYQIFGAVGNYVTGPQSVKLPPGGNSNTIQPDASASLNLTVLEPGKCTTRSPGFSWNIPTTESNNFIDFTYPTGSTGAVEGDVSGVGRFNSWCEDPTDYAKAIEYNDCALTCSVTGVTCVANDNRFGSCHYWPGEIYDYDLCNNFGHHCGNGGYSIPDSCTPSYNQCKAKTYKTFDGWKQCVIPTDSSFTLHLYNYSSPGGMGCFKKNEQDYDPAIHQNLPICLQGSEVNTIPDKADLTYKTATKCTAYTYVDPNLSSLAICQ